MKIRLNGESPISKKLLLLILQAIRGGLRTPLRLHAITSEQSDQRPEYSGLDKDKDNPVLNTSLFSLPQKEIDEVASIFPNKFSGTLLSLSPFRFRPGEFYRRPGIYMILCTSNGKRYYGESLNISVRMSKHLYELKKAKHPNKALLRDWTLFGGECFDFQVIAMGPEWALESDRIEKEVALISEDRSRCYNTYAEMSDRVQKKNPFYGKAHSEGSKRRMSESSKGVANTKLGSLIEIEGVQYDSYAEASRVLDMDRKTISKRVQSRSVRFSNWKLISNAKWKKRGDG